MSKNDDKIKQLLSKVEEQRAALGTKPKASWETNAIFKYPDGSHININTVKDPQILVEALSFLIQRELGKKVASERLGVEPQPFQYNGYAITEYESDFKKRIQLLKYDARKKKLQATESKLKQLVSEEARTEMELTEIEALLG